jgi:hypothetical protein
MSDHEHCRVHREDIKGTEWKPKSVTEVVAVYRDLCAMMWSAGYDRFEMGPDVYCEKAYGIRAYLKTPSEHWGCFPRVWGIVQRLGLSYGCGSGHSHQTYRHPFFDGMHYNVGGDSSEW